ncbi:MAG: hypothetical protein ACPGSE_08825, partial [Synechococcus sp.]
METVVAATPADHHLKSAVASLLPLGFGDGHPRIIVGLQQQRGGAQFAQARRWAGLLVIALNAAITPARRGDQIIKGADALH